jgi:predicted ATP-grasp superfamily ATP-dependent carboligase
VHWFREMVDLLASVVLFARGKMDLTTYLRSWRGKKTLSVLSLKDPMPFLAEILMIPYILKKRGL